VLINAPPQQVEDGKLLIFMPAQLGTNALWEVSSQLEGTDGEALRKISPIDLKAAVRAPHWQR
jgi:hypothetical protein